MEDFKITSIDKCKLNNKNVKIARVYKWDGSYWMYQGTYDVPARTANKRIIQYLLDNQQL